MIPKTIHYIWVGKNPIPKDLKRCMKTWKKHLKGYEIKRWDENNFDINSHPFVKKAYEAKKWAFVSDYIRMWAIYNEGGIYLDTDVLVVSSIDEMLNNQAFVGFENDQYPFTAAFGAIKGHSLIKSVLDYYNTVGFEFDKDNQFENVNTKIVSDILINKYHCKTGNIEQLLADDIKVYKSDILCNPSINSKTIHIFTGTWMEGKKEFKRKLVKFFKLRCTNKFMIRVYLFFVRR